MRLRHAIPAAGEPTVGSKHSVASRAAQLFDLGRLRTAAMTLVGLAVGALLWEYIGSRTPETSFASFTDTMSALWDMIGEGELAHALKESLEVFAVGLGFAILVGFFLGLAMARIETLRTGLEPYVAMLYATPTVALVPFVLAAFGLEFRAKVIVVWFFGVWPILINTLEGARSVNTELLEVARSYRSNERQLWSHVVIPYTLPYTMTGIRQAIARCFVGVIVSEFLLAATGLGGLILVHTHRFETAAVLASVFSVTLVATMLMGMGRVVENYFARWRVEE